MADLIEQPVAVTLSSLSSNIAELEDAAAEAPSVRDTSDDTDYYDNVIIKLTINTVYSLTKMSREKRRMQRPKLLLSVILLTTLMIM